jgi:AcrR family transcriptional regulator
MPDRKKIDYPLVIIEQATRLFVEHGYQGISMREIAEASGLSKPGLYYYFKDKETLFIKILEDYLYQMSSLIQECSSTDLSASERLASTIRALFNQQSEKRSLMRLATQEMSQLSPAARESFNHLYHTEFIGRIQAIIADGIHLEQFQSADVSTLTWVLLGMMYPFFYPGMEHTGLASDSQTVQTIIDIFLNGVKKHG